MMHCLRAALACMLILPLGACAVVSVATTAVSVAGTAVSLGVSAGSAVAGAVVAVAKNAAGPSGEK